METLTAGRLAQLGGVNIETIRYYERRGLLAKPPRTEAGYRQFSADTAHRVRFIKRAQQLGFTLDEIAELLQLRHDPQQSRIDVNARASAKIAEIERKIETLSAMRSVLRELVERCDLCASDECPILASLEQQRAL